MKFIDTHCHPYLLKVKDKGDAIQNFTKAGGGFFVSIWVDLPTSLTSLRFVSKYPFGRTSAWIHPCDIKDLSLIDTISKLEKIYLSNKDKVVAIWETGLDAI